MRLRNLSIISLVFIPTPALATTYVCEACPAGTWGDGTNCNTCSAGTYAYAGASSCTKCPAGTYSTGGASSCTACSGASGTSWDVGSCGIIGGTYYTYCNKQGSTYSTDGAISHRTSKNVGGCGSGNYCSSGSCYSCGSVSNGSYSSNGLTIGSCSLSCIKGYKVEDGVCRQTERCEERGIPTGCGNNCPSPTPSTLGIMTEKECRQVKRGGSCEILWGGKHLKRCSY
ncbi:MAG: hypothetical protein IJ473_02430 [Alphaproteobacteria bacterium]|nr:hypothetical protein [Alphaproteobacteria bacterium]